MLNRADGTVLRGRYRLDGVIGAGGMGVVYRGHDLQLERDVAIKLLHPGLATDPAARARFAHEARAAARLTSAHVVAVFDNGEHNGVPFIVMELLSGSTVAGEIAGGPLPVARVRVIAEDMLAALAHAHRHGVVHRDVKPGNLLVADGGHVKVSDFGIATSAVADVRTATGEVSGSLPYIAPERLQGNAASPQSDLFSAGVVLYEALTGTRPFARDTPAATMHEVLVSTPPPLQPIRPDVDERFAQAIEIALRKRPEERFESADAMLGALRAESIGTITPTMPIAPVVPTVPSVPSVSTVATAPITAVAVDAPTEVMPEVVTARAPVKSRRRTSTALLLAGGVAAASLFALIVGDGSAGSGRPRATTPTTTVVISTLPPSTVPATSPTTVAVRKHPPRHHKHRGPGAQGPGG